MKYCAYCGNMLEDNMMFCPKCGKKQSSFSANETNESAPTSSLVQEQQTKSSLLSKRNIFLMVSVVGIISLITLIVLLLQNRQSSDIQSATIATEVATDTPLPTEPSSPEPPTIAPTEEPFSIIGNPNAIEKLSRSVVKLTCYDEFGNEYASGSGFFAFESNLIVTNYHVIDGNVYSITANSDGKEFNVDLLVNYNERYDLALLQISSSEMKRKNLDFEPLVVADSSDLKISEHVTAIGVPLGISKTVSDGMISGFFEDSGIKLIQFTAPISHGSSGGALLNDRGEVIGITSASFSDGQNFNLTVPSSYISILYNANPNKERIITFHNKRDPYYSVDYCLLNHDHFGEEREIKVYGYVSSTVIGSNILYSVLTSDQQMVVNLLVSKDEEKHTEQEWQKIQEVEIAEVEAIRGLKKIFVVENESNSNDFRLLTPGSIVVITGKIHYSAGNGLGILASNVEVIS